MSGFAVFPRVLARRPAGTTAANVILIEQQILDILRIMPVLSKFYGIVIRMLFTRSFRAHFHATYDRWELVVGISPLVVIQGDAPSRVRDMVLECAKEHQWELQDAWNRCARAERPITIAPLN